MALLFKCKMCGGDLEVAAGEKIGTCVYCGSTQTLPRLDSDERASLFDRAGHYRRNSEYDKALTIYERLLEADGTDSEAYWSLVLCRYGVEYVKDPKSDKRIITCNRTLTKSILTDADYKQALAFGESGAGSLYEAEATEIDRIQREALAIIDREEPFDIFICYKQTDRDGRPTKDSRRAQDIYDALTKEGYKVFFSKITLEGKLGTEYEPYIFAALQSARVMVVVGTSKENFEATWVRNEWSRFLAMMEADRTKKLVPAYEDMDPYDMPDEFAMLQALSMDSFTFVQDLVRGVDKLLKSSEGNSSSIPPQAVVYSTAQTVVSTSEPLVKRARLMCEDGDFDKANELIDQALNTDPENGSAYLVALMAQHKCHTEERLGELEYGELSGESSYQKAVRFGDKALKERLESYDAQAKVNLEVKQRKDAEMIARAKQTVEVFNGKTVDDTAKQEAEILNSEIETMTGQISDIQGQVNNMRAQEQQLEHRRQGLGLFAKAEKQQIAAQLADLAKQKAGKESDLKKLQAAMNAKRTTLQGLAQPVVLQWRALYVDVDNLRVLAVTEDIVTCKAYDKYSIPIDWENCSLRQWLNGEFYASLSNSAKTMIVEVTNKNPSNQDYNTPGGNDTIDKVFLLSASEVQWLFQSDKDRIAQYNGKARWWWLRSPGITGMQAVGVNGVGSVGASGLSVNDGTGGVRPALWLNLESGIS